VKDVGKKEDIVNNFFILYIINMADVSSQTIKQIVVLYSGRFQPMGPHHAGVYEKIKAHFESIYGSGVDTYVVTSNKVELPDSPFNFEQKKQIINSHGITNVVQVKSPYAATEILSKYDPETTAAIYIVGHKDTVRTKSMIGVTKAGKPKHYKMYNDNVDSLTSYKKHSYLYIEGPSKKMMPDGEEMSGTKLRGYLKGATEEEFQEVMEYDEKHTKLYEMIKGVLQKALGSRKRKKKKTKRKPKKKGSKKSKNKKKKKKGKTNK
jgi:hypothetical protein